MDTATGRRAPWASSGRRRPVARTSPAADPDDPGDVVGDVEGMGIALCPVPEPKTVKHRVHLDVHTDSVDSLLALGATPAPGYDTTTRGRCCSTPRAASSVRSCATRCRRTAAAS